MNQDTILWTQKANSNSGVVKNFGYFLYEFVSARLTIIAFLGLFNVATYSFKYFGQFLTISIAIFLYYIISDSFKVFWTGINLQYSITREGVYFHWGVLKDDDLFISFDSISGITSTHKAEGKRSALIFENDLNYRNADFGFSSEMYFGQLSFENVSDMEELIGIVEDVSNLKVELLSTPRMKPWEDNVPESGLYFKFLQLLAFVLIFLATGITLKMVDNNILESSYVNERVVSQKTLYDDHKYKYIQLETQSGYKMKLQSFYEYEGNEIGFHATPIFKHVTKFDSFNSQKFERVQNGFLGFNLVFKWIALFTTLFCGTYIFYKRYQIPIADLSIFLCFPILVLFVAFYLFH